MLLYLIKCFAFLLTLWLGRYFRVIPWSDMINLVMMVVIPMVIAALAWLAGAQNRKQTDEYVTADDALSVVENQLVRRL